MAKKHQTKSAPRQEELALRFTDAAWNQILSARDAVDTEIGMMLIPDADDAFLIVGIEIPPQECTWGHCDVLPEAAPVIDILEAELEAHGYPIPSIAERYWLHTHPGSSADPSTDDHKDFATRQELGYPYLVHVILAKQGSVWARVDTRIGETSLYVQSPIKCIKLPSEHDVATIELARSRVRKPAPAPTIGFDYPRRNGYYVNGHYVPFDSSDRGPGVRSPQHLLPRELEPQPVPVKRRAKRQPLHVNLLTTEEEKEYDELFNMPISSMTQAQYERWEFLDGKRIGLRFGKGLDAVSPENQPPAIESIPNSRPEDWTG